MVGEQAPFLSEFIQADICVGFYNPMGVLAIGGLHGLPVLLYATAYGTDLIRASGIGYLMSYAFPVLVAGRLLCGVVEICVVWAHIQWMCEGEKAQRD